MTLVLGTFPIFHSPFFFLFSRLTHGWYQSIVTGKKSFLTHHKAFLLSHLFFSYSFLWFIITHRPFFYFSSITANFTIILMLIHWCKLIYSRNARGDLHPSRSLHYFRDSSPSFLTFLNTNSEIFCKSLWISLLSWLHWNPRSTDVCTVPRNSALCSVVLCYRKNERVWLALESERWNAEAKS